MKLVSPRKRRAARCDATKKVRYRTHEDATRALRSYRQMESDDFAQRDRWPVRCYRCSECRGWHLTSLAVWQDFAAGESQDEEGEERDAG